MADDIRRDERDEQDGRAGLSGHDHPREGDFRGGQGRRPAEHGDPGRASGSPLGTDPQEAAPLPGDPREAQQPQEPRTSHVPPGRDAVESRPARASDHRGSDEEEDQGVVDHLRDAWDRVRGKK